MTEFVVRNFLAQGLAERLLAVLLLTALDAALAIALAIREGHFVWKRMADFIRINTLPYLLGYASVHFVSFVGQPLTPLFGDLGYVLDGTLANLIYVVMMGSIGVELGEKVFRLTGKKV